MKEDDRETRKFSEEKLREIHALIRSQQPTHSSLETISLEDITDENTVKEGSTFGHYLLVSTIGRGGMGNIFKAVDQTTDEIIAIKFIREDLFGDIGKEKCIRRFLREAKVLSENKHSNLISLIDYGEVNGDYYYTMEFIGGEDLRSLLGYGPLQINKSIRMAKSIAGALLVMHEQGVIHRDVKPENIMVTDAGIFVLIDCGIAKFMYGMPTLTSIGRLLGTPEHMSPEHAMGKPIDERSDIYSLNTALYEALCSFPPFIKKRKESIYEFLKRIVNEKPKPVIELNMMVPPGLNAIVEKGMAKDPNDRYQNCKEYIAALEEVEQKI